MGDLCRRGDHAAEVAPRTACSVIIGRPCVGHAMLSATDHALLIEREREREGERVASEGSEIS